MTMKEPTPANLPIIIGQISGVFGVHGWVKVFSYTEPRENILSYDPWQVKNKAGWQERSFVKGRKQGKTIVAQLKGVDDRDKAHTLIGCDIAINSEQLKKLDDNEFYWRELAGLKVVTCNGDDLGTVKQMMATGANDVIVVEPNSAKAKAKAESAKQKTELLIPYLTDSVVKKVDLENGLIEVDWEYWDDELD